MKQFHLVCLSSLVFLLTAAESIGDVTPAKMSSTTKPSATIQERKLLEKPELKGTPTPTLTPPTPITPPAQVVQEAAYLHPGILVFLNGRWEGSDHLLNLTNNIGVYVTILKPENEVLDVSQEQLQKEIQAIFEQANIKPVILTAQGRPPLPVFEIEIFLYPIDRGYAACCDGRLFESVTVDRFKMDPNMAFQAITWEKQTLIVGPKPTFGDQLKQTIQSIASTFVERYQAYERLKGQLR